MDIYDDPFIDAGISNAQPGKRRDQAVTTQDFNQALHASEVIFLNNRQFGAAYPTVQPSGGVPLTKVNPPKDLTRKRQRSSSPLKTVPKRHPPPVPSVVNEANRLARDIYRPSNLLESRIPVYDPVLPLPPAPLAPPAATVAPTPP